MSKHNTMKDGVKTPDFTIEAQDEVASARVKAAFRWKAITVLNASSLTARAKAVGIALVCMMDAQSRECRASAERISDYANVPLASVKRGKAQLREAGYLDWAHPDGPTGTCLFRFNYQKIEREAAARRDFVKSRAEARRLRAEARRQAVIESLDASFDGTPDDEASITGEPNGDDDGPELDPDLLGSKLTLARLKTDPRWAQNGTSPSTEMSPYSISVLSSLVLPSSVTMNRAASHLEGAPIESTPEGCGGEGEADRLDLRHESEGQAQPPSPPPASSPAPAPPPGQPSEGEMRLGAHAAPPPVILPSLRETWQDDAEALALLARMSPDTQLSISGHLANKGKTAARQYLDEKAQAEAMMARFPALAAAFGNDARLLKLMQRACFDVLDDASKALARKGPGAAAAVLLGREEDREERQ